MSEFSSDPLGGSVPAEGMKLPTKNTGAISSGSAATGKGRVFRVKQTNKVAVELQLNDRVKELIATIPANYNFEIIKTLEKVSKEKPKLVALQFPEGLLMYANIISNIITSFHEDSRIIIMADVTYGACCVDDFTAKKLGVDLLVHYGHSCLVPLQATQIKTLYVFVEISFDTSHLLSIIRENFDKSCRLALMGTIQFVASVAGIRQLLKDEMPNLQQPQCKPLSSGETLGCTSAVIPDCDALVFVADGRFHLEAAMIQNPQITAFRYDPYSKVMTREGYDVDAMKDRRLAAIKKARSASVFGLILGSLGRQGNPVIFNRIKKLLQSKGKTVIPFIMAEIQPAKLEKIATVDAWIQVACPRLSIDWGTEFSKPMLSPYELEVMLNESEWREVYPMDYYSNQGGPWTNYAHKT